jgi:hypothetical protein
MKSSMSLTLTPARARPAAHPPHLRAAVLIATALLGGCASFSPDGGFATVEQTAKDRLGKEVRWSRSAADQDSIDQRVSELLAKPLTTAGCKRAFRNLASPRRKWYRPGASRTRDSASGA